MSEDGCSVTKFVCDDADHGECEGKNRVFNFRENGVNREVRILCARHAEARRDNPVLLPENGGLEVYEAYRRYLEAKQTFVQTYHPERTCCHNSPECTTNEVTEYLFSDGGTQNICTVHRTDSYALMSREYYQSVYKLRCLWSDTYFKIVARK